MLKGSLPPRGAEAAATVHDLLSRSGSTAHPANLRPGKVAFPKSENAAETASRTIDESETPAPRMRADARRNEEAVLEAAADAGEVLPTSRPMFCCARSATAQWLPRKMVRRTPNEWSCCWWMVCVMARQSRNSPDCYEDIREDHPKTRSLLGLPTPSRDGCFRQSPSEKRSDRFPPHDCRSYPVFHVPKAAIHAALDGRSTSDLGSLSQEERVLPVDAKIAHRVLDLGVTEQDLDGADVSCRLVNHRRLRASQ